MDNVLDTIDYYEVAGTVSSPRLTVYALSTCAFCKRAMAFLKDHGLSYRYVYLDQLDFDLKREVKTELKAKFDNLPVFPVLTIDGADALSGFAEDKWAARLGIDAGHE